MRLCLQSYTNVLDRAGEYRIGNTSKGTGGIVLRVRELAVSGLGGVASFESAARIVEATELNRYASSDTD